MTRSVRKQIVNPIVDNEAVPIPNAGNPDADKPNADKPDEAIPDAGNPEIAHGREGQGASLAGKTEKLAVALKGDLPDAG